MSKDSNLNIGNIESHFLSISSKKKVDLAIGGDFGKSLKLSLSSSHSMRQKPKVFQADIYKELLKGQKIYIQMYYHNELIKSGYQPYIIAMGGQVFQRLTSNVTVILTNELTKERLSSLNKRVLKVSKSYIPIVSILWLEEIYQQKIKVPKQQFLLTQNDIQDKVEEQQDEFPEYFLQELKQDIIASLKNQQKEETLQRFFHIMDKKNKKQVMNQKLANSSHFQIIQAQSFTVTHDKILQKIPKKKKQQKKQVIGEQAEKRKKKISQQLKKPTISTVLIQSSNKSKSEPKQLKKRLSSDIENQQRENVLDQFCIIQKQSKEQAENPITLNYLLEQYCRANEQEKQSIEHQKLNQSQSTISLRKSKLKKSQFRQGSQKNFQNQNMQFQNFSNLQENYADQRHFQSSKSFKNNSNNSQLFNKQKIQHQITNELQTSIKDELQKLGFISSQKSQYCINILCRDQKIVNNIKKMNEKFCKKNNVCTYYFNLINQLQFTDRINNNQVLKNYFQLQKNEKNSIVQKLEQYSQQKKTQKFLKRREDSQQQKIIIQNSLYEVRKRLGYPYILYLCDKRCKLDCILAQISSIPKNQIIDFHVINAIAQLNAKLVSDSQNNSEKEKNSQSIAHRNPFLYKQIAKLYKIKAIVNIQNIYQKNIAILDSYILKNSLEYIIQKLGGNLVNPLNYVMGSKKCDIIITSKRSIKTFESNGKHEQEKWQVDAEQFIDSLITIQA